MYLRDIHQARLLLGSSLARACFSTTRLTSAQWLDKQPHLLEMSGKAKSPNPRVDGWDAISADAPRWLEIPLPGPPLEDVKYHHAAGEGIAKVTCFTCNPLFLILAMSVLCFYVPRENFGRRIEWHMAFLFVSTFFQITIDRPELHNAFRPRTVLEMSRALAHAQDDTAIGVIIMVGEVISKEVSLIVRFPSFVLILK